jgi:hypothetical protein
MSIPDPSLQPAPSDPAREWTERHLPALAELVDIGMNLARLVGAQATEAATHPADTSNTATADIGDLALKFARVARAVRQTVALGAKLSEDLAVFDARDEDRRAAGRKADAALVLKEQKALGAARKQQAADLFAGAVEAETPEDEREDLFSDLGLWMIDSRFDQTFIERPIGEIIDGICRDLGVARDWSRLDEAELERLQRRPSLRATAYATWPPGGSDAPTQSREDRPPKDKPTPARPPPLGGDGGADYLRSDVA